MIQPLRCYAAAVGLTGKWGMSAIRAARRGVPDEPGGVYDQATWNWSDGLLRACGITVRVEHAERLSPRPCVYIANHLSVIDIWAVVVGLPTVPKFIMKKELMRIPFFGTAAAAAGHIVIDRQRRVAAFESYRRAAAVIRRGASACVFAEGTRSRDGRLMPFKKGPFVLAIAAQVPVVPVLVTGAYELMPRLAPWPRRGEVALHVGTEIPTTGLDYEDRDQLSVQAREAMIAMGARVD
jgi:1-acyl-sn-glycerol-3-phosphate acyltransferase